VPLNNDARKAIRDWLAIRPQSNSSKLWISLETAEKSGISGRSVQRVLARLAAEARLGRVSPHQIRHSFAKRLADEGISLEKIAALLGHASLNTTRTYITPSEQDLVLAVEKLN
jgi:integrase/recombinase XerC